jgi:hypothetical protein
VPDDVARSIQDDFVKDRQSGETSGADAATDRLKRRMRIARRASRFGRVAGCRLTIRLLAQSHADQQLTQELWAHACTLDSELSRRMTARA